MAVHARDEAVGQPDIWTSAKGGHGALQPAWKPYVVSIEQGHQLRRAVADGSVASGRKAGVRLPNVAEAVAEAFGVGMRALWRAVLAAVVDEQDAPVCEGLGEDAVERSRQKVRGVVRRNNDVNGRHRAYCNASPSGVRIPAPL